MITCVLVLFVLIASATCEVRDGQYFGDLCFRLAGSSMPPWPGGANSSVSSCELIPRNVIATRFQGWRDQMFVVTSRLKPGVPLTLGKFDILQRCFPRIQPFPSWALQDGSSPLQLHNAVDLYVDTRDRLWVLDTGMVNVLSRPERRGPPKVMGFDALTGKLEHTVDLSDLTCEASRPQQLLADRCLQTGLPWMYVGDAATRSIIVYDVAKNQGHRVILPKAVDPDGPRDVLYLSLIQRPDLRKRVYFTYLSSNRMFSISVQDLRNATGHGTIRDEGVKPRRLVLLGAADNSIFFRYKKKPDIFMWNVDSTFKESNFIPVQDGEIGRVASQVSRGYGGLLWVMEGNYQDFLFNSTGCLGANVIIHPLARH